MYVVTWSKWALPAAAYLLKTAFCAAATFLLAAPIGASPPFSLGCRACLESHRRDALSCGPLPLLRPLNSLEAEQDVQAITGGTTSPPPTAPDGARTDFIHNSRNVAWPRASAARGLRPASREPRPTNNVFRITGRPDPEVFAISRIPGFSFFWSRAFRV